MNNENPLRSEDTMIAHDHNSPHDETSQSETEDYPVLTEIAPVYPNLIDATLNETAWNELEQQLSKRIQQQIEERIQFVLEESIQQNLTASIQKITGTLVTEVKKDLQSTLDVVVSLTVTNELHRLRQKTFFSENNHPKIAEENETKTDPSHTNR